MDAGRVVAAVLLLAAGAGLAACRGDRGARADGGLPLVGHLDLRSLFGGEVHGPQVVADEEITIAAHAWRGPGFTLPSARSVHVVATAKERTDKFKVYIMAADELPKFEKHKPFKDVPAFEGLKVHALDRTATLQAGSWCVVVHNSENAVRAMVVDLRVFVSAS